MAYVYIWIYEDVVNTEQYAYKTEFYNIRSD